MYQQKKEIKFLNLSSYFCVQQYKGIKEIVSKFLTKELYFLSVFQHFSIKYVPLDSIILITKKSTMSIAIYCKDPSCSIEMMNSMDKIEMLVNVRSKNRCREKRG